MREIDKYIKNGIEYVGIRKNLPQDAILFGEINFYDTLRITECKGNLKSIISASIDSNIVDYSVIDTIKGRGNDGTSLLGKKIIVDGEYTLNLQYITDTAGKTVFASKFKYSKFGEITVPPKISNNKVEDLRRRRRIKITPFVEDLFVDIVGSNNININTTIILNLEVN